MAFFKTPAPADLTKPMSRWSDAPIPTCNFADQNMLLGAGMVIFQEETDKIVVCYEQKKHYWFFPKGRKDIGESLEQTALREAYEESGYRVKPLLLNTQTPAPPPSSDPTWHWMKPNFEPIMVNIQHYPLREYPNGTTCLPGEYLSFWYVGSIAADAVPEENTRMEDEINYQTHLVTYDEAKKCLFPDQVHVLKYAKVLLEHTRKVQAHRRQISEPVETADVSANSAATAGGKPKYPSIPGYHDPEAELYSHNAFGDVYV